MRKTVCIHFLFLVSPSFFSFTPSGYVKTSPMREKIAWRNNMVVVNFSLMDSTCACVCRFAFF